MSPDNLAKPAPWRPWGCWTLVPVRHPFNPLIADCACGYDERQVDGRCDGCHRQRPESALAQLNALDARHTADGLTK